jgi:ketosteroid isomerase-like protein
MAMILRTFATLVIAASCLLTVASARAHEPDAEEVALGSLVDAELGFARAGARQGIRAAFLANFAADGVALEPAPVRVLDAWPARPAPADPLALHLDWKPAQAGVARSHDFGYTTGPYVLWNASDPARKQHGAFFSVWRRDGNGTWKVILDAGITSPAAVDFAALGAAPRPSFARRGKPADARRELLAQEADGFGSGSSGLTPNAYARLVADDVRLHRNGSTPIASRSAVAHAVAQRMRRVVWMPIDARVARSGDMAVTYGRYRETDRASNTSDGFYAHLWLRDRAGHWQLAYDVALPAS